ncbi:MAG: Uma2 family endonuclease [Bacillota bacterium]
MPQALNTNAHYTYGDYLTWPENERWEIINGQALAMSPSPGPNHQVVVVELVRQFANYLSGKPCRVFAAPLDVLLPGTGSNDVPEHLINNVVQPDILVVCDPDKIGRQCIKGAPDLVVEVLSANSVRRDRYEKFHLYEQAGVKEYWLVEPEARLLTVFKLGEDGLYGRPEIYAGTEQVPVGILTGLTINLQVVFAGLENDNC